MKTSIIQAKSFQFSLDIILPYKELINENEYVISKQLLRSATSIGANVEEAEAGYSYKDFSSKMSIASKEARESRYWLRLLKYGDLTTINVDKYLESVEELTRILTSIVKTTQNR